MKTLISNKKLANYVWSFIDEHGLLKREGRVVVGLSGGADSMLLGHLCAWYYQEGKLNSVRFIHVDHGLRQESHSQAQELNSLCQRWNWEIEIIPLKSKAPKSDIENWARDERHRVLKNNLKEDEVLLLAHQIDDSFEWYLRSLLGSSQGDLVMGIPLIHKHIRRPLHCLGRKQIISFIKKFHIPLVIDGSNDDVRFERNRLRKEVKKPLFEIYPKGLAHYVEHANRWANDQFNKSRESEYFHHISYASHSSPSPSSSKAKSQKELMIAIYPKEVAPQGSDGLSSLFSLKQELKGQCIKAIRKLSTKERGELRQNLNKLVTAYLEGGNAGPLHFSGGVLAKVYPELILFYHEDFPPLLNILFQQLQSVVASQIPGQSILLREMEEEVQKARALPIVIFRGKTFGLKGLKQDPLLNELIKGTQNTPWHIRPLTHLIRAAKKQSRYEYPVDGFCIAF